SCTVNPSAVAQRSSNPGSLTVFIGDGRVYSRFHRPGRPESGPVPKLLNTFKSILFSAQNSPAFTSSSTSRAHVPLQAWQMPNPGEESRRGSLGSVIAFSFKFQ